ncbi:MAG: ornithine cyclodeaminase family protein [Pseudomonadota bacterium]
MHFRILSRDDVAALLDRRGLIEVMKAGFVALTVGSTVAPGRSRIDVPGQGFLLNMGAWQPDRHLAVKLVTVYENNPNLDLPRHQAVITLIDHNSGTPRGLMDATLITAERTAAGSAIATDLLASPDARVLAIIGAGVQGQAHLELVGPVRNFTEIKIAGRRPEDAERLAATHAKATAVSTNEDAAREADVICLCTNASDPVLDANAIKTNAHINSVGFAPPGSELDPAIIERAQVAVETRNAPVAPPVRHPRTGAG